MKIYAVFDTNILVSAMISKSIAMFFTARNFTCPKHWLMGSSAILRSPVSRQIVFIPMKYSLTRMM